MTEAPSAVTYEAKSLFSALAVFMEVTENSVVLYTVFKSLLKSVWLRKKKKKTATHTLPPSSETVR